MSRNTEYKADDDKLTFLDACFYLALAVFLMDTDVH